jgi:outer membrane protein TolC
VHRRPDVRSAFYDIKAADRGVAAAVADRYPSITLAASASVANDDATGLFDDWMRSIAADLLQPLFDAGQREAEVRRTESVKAQRLDTYGQTVLTAFREVTDALSREYHQQKQIESIRKQLSLAQRTSERLRREYLNGDISYIDVLDALTRQQQLQRDLLQARFELIDNRIDLYRALAGGWDGIVPPTRDSTKMHEPPATQPAATGPATQPAQTQSQTRPQQDSGADSPTSY